MKFRTSQDQYTEKETAKRRDEAIQRALRTPPVTLEELKKKRKPKSKPSATSPSAKR